MSEGRGDKWPFVRGFREVGEEEEGMRSDPADGSQYISMTEQSLNDRVDKECLERLCDPKSIQSD
jgi:hypothetical protein